MVDAEKVTGRRHGDIDYVSRRRSGQWCLRQLRRMPQMDSGAQSSSERVRFRPICTVHATLNSREGWDPCAVLKVTAFDTARSPSKRPSGIEINRSDRCLSTVSTAPSSRIRNAKIYA
jgi:hypothetical protein